MRPENQLLLEKIKKASRILRMVCKTFMGLATLGFLPACIALLINRGGTIRSFNSSFVIGELTMPSRLLLLAVSALTFGVVFKCFFDLDQLLGNYSRGEIFTVKSAGRIRQLGVNCILWGIMNVVWSFLPILVSSHRPRTFEGNPDLVVIGLIIFVISWFMEMAAELQEENELTV